ncbi:MAG: hypothetical protein DRN78_00510 [Thermoproteota archaeon]|nr:MAG: hypothetical protein DRN78_00510 [Candidatus Korarchaeota archaeon]
MTIESLTREEKERLLKTIEEDREFRYALMGLLGFKEILDRITKLEERFTKLEERFTRLEEEFEKLAERQQKLEERQQRLEERFIRLEERQQKLEEQYQELVKRMTKVEERLEKLDRTIIAIAHRFGILTEASFREAMKYVVEETLGVAKVERWVYRDEEGIVYGYPAIIEVDIVVKDEEHILVEVKSRVSRSDVSELYRIGKLYEKVHGIKPKLLIIGGFIDTIAYEAAAKLGIEIKPLLREELRI